MAAFEFNEETEEVLPKETISENAAQDIPGRRDECIIALKVYDSCRQQCCLGEKDCGPARAAECAEICGVIYTEGEVITPPTIAASATVKGLRIEKIIIASKEEIAFRRGYWDIGLKYVFKYDLIFREADGNELGSLKANSIFNNRVSLFGSISTDIVIATDIIPEIMLGSDPITLVEAKAVPLAAAIRYSLGSHGVPEPNHVDVSIGLFSLIKLSRIVQLSVESKGFSIPGPCSPISPMNPCDFFESLAFPVDIFAPPEKSEFPSGPVGPVISGEGSPCGCYG